MKRIMDWITEGITGKRYIMGRYRKVSRRKPMRLIGIYLAVMAVITVIIWIVG